MNKPLNCWINTAFSYVERHEPRSDETDRHVEAVAVPAADYAALTARVQRLEEALTASGDTKAAYIGEFKETITVLEPDDVGDWIEVDRTITISWTTTKEIMATILARANARTQEKVT